MMMAGRMATLVVTTSNVQSEQSRGPSQASLVLVGAWKQLRLDLTKDELDKSGESYYVDEKEV